MKETTAVNVRTDKCDEYVGRACGRGRFPQSEWANPYRITKRMTRERSIRLYEKWLRRRLEDPGRLARFLRLEGKRLGCWCAPEACHVDVIVKVLGELIDGGGKWSKVGGRGARARGRMGACARLPCRSRIARRSSLGSKV